MSTPNDFHKITTEITLKENEIRMISGCQRKYREEKFPTLKKQYFQH